MAMSQAHIKASNKYNRDNYKKIQANIKPDDYKIIDDYCNNTGISKAQLIVTACKEYISKHGADGEQ